MCWGGGGKERGWLVAVQGHTDRKSLAPLRKESHIPFDLIAQGEVQHPAQVQRPNSPQKRLPARA